MEQFTKKNHNNIIINQKILKISKEKKEFKLLHLFQLWYKYHPFNFDRCTRIGKFCRLMTQ